MDKLNEYRCLIKRLLNEFADWVNGGNLLQQEPPKDELVCIFDEQRDQYVVLRAHWGQYRCIHGAQIFVRIRNGKIWIEEDWTEEGIATDLLNAGIAKEDIVLGFLPAQLRPHSEFAVA